MMSFEPDDEGGFVEAPFSTSGYNAILEDSKTTASFSDAEEDNSFIQIYLTVYLDEGDGVYAWDGFPHSLYLTNSGEFIPDYMDPESYDGLVELTAGESVTFKLPSWYNENEEQIGPAKVVYALRLEKWYPDTAYEFIDVPENEYYAAPVAWAFESELIGEDFDPGKGCTRATAVTYFRKAAGGPGAEGVSFTDVPADADYATAVTWAVNNKITNGDGSEDIFSPDKVCTRGQIVTFLYRLYAEEAWVNAQ